MKINIVLGLILIIPFSLLSGVDFAASEASQLSEQNKIKIINSIPAEIKDKMVAMTYEQIKKEASISPFKVAKIEINYGNARPQLDKLEKVGKGASYFLFEEIKQDLTKNGYKFGECMSTNIFHCTVLW